MEIYLTDIDIAYCILVNITKSEIGNGILKINFPLSYTLVIDYRELSLNGRKISIDGPDNFHEEWIGSKIVPSEIQECLKTISSKF